MGAVDGVTGAELGFEKLLFAAGLEAEDADGEEEAEERAVVAGNEGGSGEGGQQAGVERVADVGVGTGGDELMVDLNDDAAAPVAAEDVAGPGGEGEAEDGEDESRESDGVAVMKARGEEGEMDAREEDEGDGEKTRQTRSSEGSGAERLTWMLWRMLAKK